MGQRASVGTVIEGKYRLEEELGAGGMGSVWLATQLMVDRPVAVKLLHPAFIDQDDLQARFEVEAKAIGRLNHPNVITLYDFGFSEDLQAFYTVIEYIDGVSLDKRLNDRLTISEVVEIIRQIALALDHAHHYNILHRDLKPENVMLASMTDGTEMVKVLDFGIARIVKGSNQPETQESQRITKAGEVFGTPAYMSPEQARSIRQLKPSADLYSLGVMFYELVAGGLPFFAHSAFDLLMLHVTKPVPPIRGRHVPEDVQDIIYKLLQKDPEKRFQSGKELVEALDALELPDEEELPSPGEFDSGPTMVQKTPTPTIGAPPAHLGDEETNPETPPDFSVTPSGKGTPPPTPEELEESQSPTMMLDGNVDVSVETGRFDNDRGPARLWIAGFFAVLLATIVGLLAWAGLGDNPAATEPDASEATAAEEIEVEQLEPRELEASAERELAEAPFGTKPPAVEEPKEETEENKPVSPTADAAKRVEPKANSTGSKPTPEAEATKKPAPAAKKKKPKTRRRRAPRKRRAKPKPAQTEKEKKPLFDRYTTDDGEEEAKPNFDRVDL